MVEQGVHFDASLGLPERCPREKRQAELDGCGIQAEQLGFETELVLWSFCRAQAVHFGKQVFEKIDRPGVIRIGKGGTGYIVQSPVVQALAHSLKTAQTVTHGAPCGKLDKCHYGELLFEAEFS